MTLKSDSIRSLSHIATMLELLGEDAFRVNANARAVRSLEAFPDELEPIADDQKQLTAIPGIGAKIAQKIIELHTSGRISEEDELARKVPQTLLEVLEVPGLGPKTVRLMWEQQQVESIDDLRRIIADGSILTLPRMGQKSVDKITAALAFMETSSERLPIGIAQPLAELLIEYLRQSPEIIKAEFAGSLRRGQETVGDIDILVATSNPAAVTKHFLAAPNLEEVLASGDTKSSARFAVPESAGGKRKTTARAIQIDLRIVEQDAWGAALLYFTGSKEHGVHLRTVARKQGFTLNEYGLFKDEPGEGPPQSRGIAPIAHATEAEIYAQLDQPAFPPEIREDMGEFDLTEAPRLIEVADIKAELHAHTRASDGRLSLHQLIEHAISRGFHTLAVTDHSRSSVQANGLSIERLQEQRQHIEDAREQFEGQITILHGCEVDILTDGSLDYDDETLHWLDLVVASPHVALTQDPKTATKRLLNAIEHPCVHILGHPTGRLINRREGLSPAINELVAAAVEHETALEINAHWQRLDLRDTHVRAAATGGARFAIDCDVHHAADFDNLRYGVATGRRGWLEPAQCVNALGHKDLHGWIKSKRV